MFDKGFPSNFMDLQIHLIIHLIGEVELVGVVSCRWMFFLERYMKNIKEFVRKMEKHEESMVEGYIVYESFYYANDYIKQIDDTPGVAIWDK